MTENKRFYTTRHHHESGFYKMVHDKSERFSFPRATRDSDLFLHCMNTLAEENEELKSENEYYKRLFFEIVETALSDKNCREEYCKGILKIFDKANSLNQAREMIKARLKE